MFRNSNSNLQYNKPLNKSSMQAEKTSALLRGLRKEYEALHNGKFEITPVYAKLIYLRKVQQDYTFWINPSIKPIRGRIENKSDEKVSKWKFAVSLGNFYSKQNGQKPLFAVFAQTPEGSLRNTTRERLKKAIELGNYYSKQNGKSLSVSCNHPTTLSGPFYNKCHYRKTTPITNKPPLFESAVVGKRNFLENYVSLQNEKLTVDHVIVGLNEQNRTTPNWLCKKYCCISKEIEACKEQFNAENYAVWGKLQLHVREIIF